MGHSFMLLTIFRYILPQICQVFKANSNTLSEVNFFVREIHYLEFSVIPSLLFCWLPCVWEKLRINWLLHQWLALNWISGIRFYVLSWSCSSINTGDFGFQSRRLYIVGMDPFRINWRLIERLVLANSNNKTIFLNCEAYKIDLWPARFPSGAFFFGQGSG